MPEGLGSRRAAALPGAARTVCRPSSGNAGGSIGLQSGPLGPRAARRVRAPGPARRLSINNTEKCSASVYGRCEYFALTAPAGAQQLIIFSRL